MALPRLHGGLARPASFRKRTPVLLGRRGKSATYVRVTRPWRCIRPAISNCGPVICSIMASIRPFIRKSSRVTITPETFADDNRSVSDVPLGRRSQATQSNRALGSRTKYKDLLVFGPHGVIDNQLRFANEPARHKVLDMIGDLFLLGHGYMRPPGRVSLWPPARILNWSRRWPKQMCQVLPRHKASGVEWNCRVQSSGPRRRNWSSQRSVRPRSTLDAPGLLKGIRELLHDALADGSHRRGASG